MPESNSTILESAREAQAEQDQLPAIKNSLEFAESSEGFSRSFWYYLLSPIRQFRSMRRIATPVTTRLTREGWQFSFMIGFVILGAVVRNVNLLVILAGTMLGFSSFNGESVLEAFMAYRRDASYLVTCKRRKPFDVEIAVSNPKRFLGAWWVVVEERITPQTHLSLVSGSAQTIGMLFPSLPPRSTQNPTIPMLSAETGRVPVAWNGNHDTISVRLNEGDFTACRWRFDNHSACIGQAASRLDRLVRNQTIGCAASASQIDFR
jgi:hypothetical protein